MRRSPDQTRPDHRSLRIFAIDPMVGRAGDHQATVQVRFEDLPIVDPKTRSDLVSIKARRVEVVDVDASGTTPAWLKPVHLDDPHIAMQHGLEPSESDPQFHQQMVYAVAMRTLEQFDRSLGRTIYFRGRRRLRLVPHAFRGSNAFYHPKLRAVLFGYFPASEESPGENLPGQTIFTCLSHDIIAHEVTHAVVDRLRPFFNVATNPQVRAFHEGFADIVAVFQRLTFRDLVLRGLQDYRGSLANNKLLSDIATQFGQGLGTSGALRSALNQKTRLQDVEEEHDLGAVLLAAVFEGFQRTYERRTADLFRIASGGTGVLPKGALHPDLVARLTSECVRTAQAVLTMCIRAFDYLPPSDVDFGAFLRALVTADWELNPLDESGLRAAVIEAFRLRGIFAMDAGSLSVSALLLDATRKEQWAGHVDEFRNWVDLAINMNVEEQRAETPDDEDSDPAWGYEFSADFRSEDSVLSTQDGDTDSEGLSSPTLLRGRIYQWFQNLDPEHRKLLGMTEVSVLRGTFFHASRRVTADGTTRFGLVVQLVEIQEIAIGNAIQKFPSGATLVIDVSGVIRFVIRSDSPKERLASLEETARRSGIDRMGWALLQPISDPFTVDYRGMHEGRTR